MKFTPFTTRPCFATKQRTAHVPSLQRTTIIRGPVGRSRTAPTSPNPAHGHEASCPYPETGYTHAIHNTNVVYNRTLAGRMYPARVWSWAVLVGTPHVASVVRIINAGGIYRSIRVPVYGRGMPRPYPRMDIDKAVQIQVVFSRGDTWEWRPLSGLSTLAESTGAFAYRSTGGSETRPYTGIAFTCAHHVSRAVHHTPTDSTCTVPTEKHHHARNSGPFANGPYITPHPRTRGIVPLHRNGVRARYSQHERGS